MLEALAGWTGMEIANKEDTVGTVMTRNPVTIKSDVPARKALQLVIEKDV